MSEVLPGEVAPDSAVSEELPATPEATEPSVLDDPATDPTDEPASSTPPSGEHAETADAADLDDAGTEDSSEMLSASPETLPVTGLIVVIPGEAPSSQRPLAGSEADEHVDGTDGVERDAAATVSDRVMVATDEGPLVEIDPALAGAEPETGERFEGLVELDETIRATIDDQIAEGGALAVGDALEAVGLAASASQVLAPVSGSVVEESAVNAAPATKAHDVDLIFFTGGANPSDNDLKALVTSASTYWKQQTNGAISQLKVNYKAKKAPTGNTKTLRCSPKYTENLWNQGAKAFGKTSQSYLTSGRHLVVIVDDNCGSLSGGVAGWGTYGKSLHSGGMVWADIGQRGGAAVSLANGLIAHEIGHNLSLGHGNTRSCTGSATDAKQSSAGKPASPCVDLEYGDVYNVMGYGSSVGGVKPPALPISQKSMLGVAPAGSVKTVNAAGGRSQTFTLQPGGGLSGLRGLKIESPTGGSYFVEYRNMSGQDSGLGLQADSWLYLDSGAQRTFIRDQGVRIMRTHTQAYSSTQNIRTSTVIPVRDTVGGRDGLAQLMRPGKNSTPWNSTARVSVVSTGATATVRVDFTPFIDVPYVHKFATEINWMSTSGLSTGIDAGGSQRKYAPSANVTREAMAAFLYRLAAPSNYTAPQTSPFKDVPKSHQFYKEIAWMYTSGLSTGISVAGGRNYAPKSSVTREAMAAFMYRLKGATYPGAAQSPFTDVKKGQPFYKEITWMYDAKLTTGIVVNGKLTYNPKGKVTREAMAAFLHRATH
ncbi:S-layer homology domain-containing protein [Leucobacter luti]|nr:S-layer homology domain-containing protein [Leucobacter luti]